MECGSVRHVLASRLSNGKLNIENKLESTYNKSCDCSTPHAHKFFYVGNILCESWPWQISGIGIPCLCVMVFVFWNNMIDVIYFFMKVIKAYFIHYIEKIRRLKNNVDRQAAIKKEQSERLICDFDTPSFSAKKFLN